MTYFKSNEEIKSYFIDNDVEWIVILANDFPYILDMPVRYLPATGKFVREDEVGISSAYTDVQFLENADIRFNEYDVKLLASGVGLYEL